MLALPFLCSAIVLAAGAGVSSSSEPETARPKVLIIGIDGLRPDAMVAAETPNLDALRAHGAWSLEAQTGMYTVSGPGWSSLLTGVWWYKHGVIDNNFTRPRYDRYPHFFKRIREVRPELRTASFVSWAPIDRYLVNDSYTDFRFFKDYEEDGDAVLVEHARRVLREEDPDVTFFYFADVDVAGHTHGFHPDSKPYLAEIEQTDGQLGSLLDAVRDRPTYPEEDWLILVSTDHGGTFDGSHGRDEPAHRTIPYIASGPSAAVGEIHPVPNLVDVPVTAMAHLGITADPDWGLDGRVSGLADRTGIEHRNLIFNGDAEYGIGPVAGDDDRLQTPGWINTSGLVVLPYGAPDGYPAVTAPGPPDRGGHFFAGGGETDRRISQTIVVHEKHDMIDRGAYRYSLSGWLGGFAGQRDCASLTAEFLDERKQTLGSARLGPVTLEDRRAEIGGTDDQLTGLVYRAAEGPVPAGTRFIRVTLECLVGEGGNDGYADNLSLTLRHVW